MRILIRSHLKKVFSSDISVAPSYQVLDILAYACGLILGLALISTKNPNFEMASMNVVHFMRIFTLQSLEIAQLFRQRNALAHRIFPIIDAGKDFNII